MARWAAPEDTNSTVSVQGGPPCRPPAHDPLPSTALVSSMGAVRFTATARSISSGQSAPIAPTGSTTPALWSRTTSVASWTNDAISAADGIDAG